VGLAGLVYVDWGFGDFQEEELMILLFPLLALALLALCFTWSSGSLWKNAGIIIVLSLVALGGYFALGYPQGVALKDKLVQIDYDPASVDYDEVHGLLEQHLFWHPEDALAQTFQGRLYFASNEYAPAADAFAKAYALLPDDPDLLVEYATTLYLTDKSPEVLATLVRKLIDHDSMPTSAHSLLANIAMDQGEFELAKSHWLLLLRQIPRDSTEAKQIRVLLNSFS
jgi:cytochrome c-type biogenesis protein CcmH/NrfG